MCLFVVLCNTECEKMLCRYEEEENCLDLEPETEVMFVTDFTNTVALAKVNFAPLSKRLARAYE